MSNQNKNVSTSANINNKNSNKVINEELGYDDIVLLVKKVINANAQVDIWTDTIVMDSNDVDHIAEEIAEELIKAGYGDVSEYKAEIRELKADLDHQIDATNDAENLASHLQDDYDKAFERLKAQEREINSLRENNIDLKEELYELHDDLDIARADKDKTIKQAKIDVLHEAKEKLDSAPNGWAYTGYVDDLIEEVQSK